MIVWWSSVKKVVVNEVRRLISSPEQIRCLLEKVDSEISNLYSDIPESNLRKESELRSEGKCPANYINFIDESNGSRTINEALLESEKKVDSLQAEIDGLRQARDKVVQAPPREWIENRLSEFDELLELNTGESAIVLRKLLGPMNLEAQYPDLGKPYYIAHSLINVLAITEPLSDSKNLDNSPNSFQWWPGRNVFEPWEFLKFIVNFKDVSLRSSGFYQL